MLQQYCGPDAIRMGLKKYIQLGVIEGSSSYIYVLFTLLARQSIETLPVNAVLPISGKVLGHMVRRLNSTKS